MDRPIVEVHIRGEVYDGDTAHLTFAEAKRIEQVTGRTYTEWEDDLRAGITVATQALVWTLMRRNQPDMRFDDTEDIRQDEVEFVITPAAKPDDTAATQDPGAAAGEGESAVDPSPEVSPPPDETPS